MEHFVSVSMSPRFKKLNVLFSSFIRSSMISNRFQSMCRWREQQMFAAVTCVVMTFLFRLLHTTDLFDQKIKLMVILLGFYFKKIFLWLKIHCLLHSFGDWVSLVAADNLIPKKFHRWVCLFVWIWLYFSLIALNCESQFVTLHHFVHAFSVKIE